MQILTAFWVQECHRSLSHHNARCAAQDFACTRCPQACERFVDVLGLKILFSIFMGKSKVRCTVQCS